MTYKTNPYPAIPTSVLVKGVWGEMNTAKERYIAHRVYPMTYQSASSGEFYKMSSKNDQIYNESVSATDKAPEIHSSEDPISYVMDEARFNYLLDPKKINKAPDRAKKRNQEEETGRILTVRACRLKMEKAAADLLFKEGVWSTEENAGADFSNPATDILTVLNDLAEQFEDLNGYLPRKLVLNATVMGYLMTNTDILAKIPNTLWGNLTDQNILFALRGNKLQDLEEILVGRQTYTSSNLKETTVTRGKLWSSDYLWLGDIDDSIAGTSVDTIDSATAGVLLDGSEEPETRVWRDEHMKKDVEYVEASIEFGVVNVDVNKGCLLKNLDNS